MTLEAWVRPTTLSSWNTVIFKEQPGYYSYALYANTGTNRPSANIYNTGDRDIRGTAQLAANTWTHLAATYDGSVLALYVNGVQNATLLTTGAIVTSTGALRIGDNTIWGEHYSRPDRRGPHLQPRPQRNRNPDGHEPPGHQP